MSTVTNLGRLLKQTLEVLRDKGVLKFIDNRGMYEYVRDEQGETPRTATLRIILDQNAPRSVWRDATMAAVDRVIITTKSPSFTLNALFENEVGRIIDETQSKAQDLRG